MSFLVATFVFVSLGRVSFLHFLWTLGSTFPSSNETLLAQSVAGFRGVQKMPPRLASLPVAIVLFGCSLLPVLIVSQGFSVGWPAKFIAALSGLIFIMRGLIGFTSWWRHLTPEQPFAALDRKYYSPFCLLIGAGFFILVTGLIQ